MNRQGPTSGERRLGWPVHLVILAALAATIGMTCDAAVASPSGRATAAHAKHLDCTAIVSLSAIQNATRLPGMQFTGHMVNPGKIHGKLLMPWFAVGRTPEGWLPGSVCAYNDLDPTAPFHQFDTDGVVAVGYGESEKNWLKVQSESSASELNSNDVPDSTCAANAPESPLNLGQSSKAFLNTVNLVACQDADPTLDPTLPTSMYLITVLTKRHDILQVGLYNATLATTEALVDQVLTSESGSF